MKRSGQRRTGRMAIQLVVLSFAALLALAGVVEAMDDNTGDGSQQLPVRGVIRSPHQAVISAQLVARILKIGFREGERFNKGDLLIALDCRQQLAQFTSATAALREMEVMLKSASFLNKRGGGSRQELETARARVERARANAEAVAVQVELCEIKAPYDGSVSELKVHEYETAGVGKPLLSITARQGQKIELIVPSSWLAWLEEGKTFTFRVDETQRSYKAVIERLGAKVDAISQTIKIFANFVEPVDRILPGMSGTADFSATLRVTRGE